MLAANGLQLYSSLETCSLLTEPTTLRDALLFSHSVVSDSLWHLWTVAHQALCPWDSPGKNTGVGCHALLRGNLPNPGIKPESLESPALAGGFFTTESSVKPQRCLRGHIPTNTANEWLVLRSTGPAPLPQGRQLWCHLALELSMESRLMLDLCWNHFFA